MAEIVQKNCESMITELECLRQTKLFSEADIRRVLKQRRHLESRVNKGSKDLNDYQTYIAHETLILKKIRKRRQELKISEKKKWLDNRIILRIRRLYQTALQRFPGDYSLHIEAFKFCKKHHFSATTSQIVDNILKMFSGKEEAWNLAAGWYRHLGDMKKAVQTLQKGLTFNPQSIFLYNTAIKFEIDKVTEAESEMKSKLQLKCADYIKIYVQLLLKNIKEVEEIISTLQILESQGYTIQVQQLILEHLFQNHCKEAIVWNMFAKREKKGMHFVTDPVEKPKSNDLVENCIVYCMNKYEQGLLLVSEHEKKKLWRYYLATLEELHEEKLDIKDINCEALLKNAFKRAHKEKCLEEDFYKIWLGMIPEKEGKKILEEATRFFQNSIDFWKIQLEIAISKNKDLDVVFQKGISLLKNKALPLWLLMLKHYCSEQKIDEMRQCFEEGIKQPADICNALKPRYIEWIAFNDGIDAARAKYMTLATEEPYCRDLHSLMVRLESSETNIDKEHLQKVHELACAQFGKQEIEVWLDYLKFLLLKKPADFLGQIEKIRSKARILLPAKLSQHFDQMYIKLLSEVE